MNIRKEKKKYKQRYKFKGKVGYFFRDDCRDSLQFYPKAIYVGLKNEKEKLKDFRTLKE